MDVSYLYPSIRQNTLASLSSNWSSHTVPQVLLKNSSTRPSFALFPPTSRICRDCEFSSSRNIFNYIIYFCTFVSFLKEHNA